MPIRIRPHLRTKEGSYKNIIGEIYDVELSPNWENRSFFEGGKGLQNDLNQAKFVVSYMNVLYNNSIISNSNPNPKKLNIVFTSLHGTSYKLLPKLLKKSGFSNIKYVKEQMIPDGNFSNVNSSNPEDESSLKEAIEIAKNNNSDLVLGTDPDADRFGIAVKNYNGKFVHINGNQTMVVLTDYLLSKLSKEKAKLSELILNLNLELKKTSLDKENIC